MNILITGVAGFIGFHTSLSMLKKKTMSMESIILMTIMMLV